MKDKREKASAGKFHQSMKLFVPGRICLFGEHSDWAGGYRRVNAELEKGFALIAGTNQGLYAEIKPHPTKFIINTTLNDGSREISHELPMKKDLLLAEAEKGKFFSYAAGVAYQVATHYRVRGLEINNYSTNLPLKKGLSSSAAICVLVARAFNRIYDLKMTVRGEMEFAYLGEITTPSRCGRMDQGCAYGNRPIMMEFDCDKIDVREVSMGKELYFVIVDLNAQKDTKEILNRLNHCYPFAENKQQQDVQKYLGSISADITNEAFKALEEGNAKQIGELMKKAQSQFDKYLQPVCPSQLTSPILHSLLNYKPIQKYIYGGKGVGSQGDGTAQFIVKDKKSQEKVIRIIQKDKGMPCLKLTLHSHREVRKAIIPAAGFGTRLFPASKVIKKELFPVIDKEGRAKPVIMAIVEEAVNSGIEEICIIVQEKELPLFEEFFCMPPVIENFNKLSKENQEYSNYIQELGNRITFITQKAQEGLGHAVYCAREWVNNEPFLLMLGDHLYASDSKLSCISQLLKIYEYAGESIVGLKKTAGNDIHKFGCAAGNWDESEKLLSITEFKEKPNIKYAQEYLRVKGFDKDIYLTVFGLYILQPEIFDYLEEHITNNVREKGEFQLTSCLDKLRRERGFTGYIVKGKRFDIGLPEVYRQTVIDFRNA